nr:hypothetical protein [Kibdelosporangium sp. MJ126-NF4]CEL23032.1 hypothetical protein [Kibdelosporangium sp. MJ126-NF4]CTQ90171.1 hypothetical protein [Kibdelosporangium sp. MJ126-NF4]
MAFDYGPGCRFRTTGGQHKGHAAIKKISGMAGGGAITRVSIQFAGRSRQGVQGHRIR